MDKQIVVYLYDKKEWTTDTCNNIVEYHNIYAKLKEPDTESCIQYDSISNDILEKTKL